MDVTLVAGVDPFSPRASGIRTHVLGLAGALGRLGHGVTIVGTGRPQGELPVWNFVPVTRESRVSSFRFLAALHRKARRIPIHGNVVHAHRADDLTAFASRTDLLARILTVHGLSTKGIAQRHGRVVSSMYLRFEKAAMRLADRVLALDRGTLSSLRSRYPEQSAKFLMGSGGVDLRLFAPMPRSEARRQLDLPDRPTVAYLGRLVREKNLPVFMEALDSLPTVQVIVAGEGPLREDVEAWGRRRKLFRFLGRLPHDRVSIALNAANVLALPSLWEAMPSICLESLACGTPVVATRVGGLDEVIRPGTNGLLVDAEPKRFAAALDHVLATSEEMRTESRRSVEGYGWDSVAERLVEIYRQAAA